MTLSAGRLLVRVDDDGRIAAVTERSRPERSFVGPIDIGACRLERGSPVWPRREVTVDADEIGIQLQAADLSIALRHSFSGGWSSRLVIVNPTSHPAVLERMQLLARPGADFRVSALAAGSRLCWAAQAVDGGGSLLTARLTAGLVSEVTKDGFELGHLRLAPGQRYVTQLRWELFATPRSVVSGPGRDVLVGQTVYQVDEGVLLPADPDAALVVLPDEPALIVDAGPDDTVRELAAVVPGHWSVELRSAEGDVRLGLDWVPPLTEQLVVWAGTVLAGPRSAAGVVAVEDLAAAIVLQAALGAGELAEADQAADALDRCTARLVADPVERTEPLVVLYLLGEHSRTGEEDTLVAAVELERRLLAGDGPAPAGLGLAVLRTALAGVSDRTELAAVLRRAVERVSVPTASRSVAGPDSVAGWSAADLELIVAVLPLLAEDHPARRRLSGLTRELGAALGCGLPGRLVDPAPPADLAHLVAVLRMLPEEGVAGVTSGWGAPPPLLAHRLTLELLDRLGDTDVGPAAAWLALVQRHA